MLLTLFQLDKDKGARGSFIQRSRFNMWILAGMGVFSCQIPKLYLDLRRDSFVWYEKYITLLYLNQIISVLLMVSTVVDS